MKTVFSLFLIFVATLSFIGAFIILGALSTIGSPAYLAEKVVNEERVEIALTFLKDQLESSAENTGDEFSEMIRQPEYQVLSDALFDVPWATEQLRQILRSFDGWLKTNDPEPRLVVRLGEKKDELQTLFDIQLRNQFAKLPACQGEQIPENACRPDGMSYEDFTLILEREGKTISSVLDNVPDELDLLRLQPLTSKFGGSVSDQTNIREGLQRTREVIRFLRLIHPMVFGVSALSLLFVLLLHRRSLRQAAGWVGFAIFIPGIVAFIVAVAIPEVAQRLLDQFSSSQPTFPEDLVRVLGDGMMGIARGSVWSMRIISGLIALVGFCLLASALFERPRKEGPTIIRH